VSEAMMITPMEIAVLLVIAVLGHLMAPFWYLAYKNKWGLCERTIYDLQINRKQMVREFINSLHTPMHSVILGCFVFFGFFKNGSWLSFVLSLMGTTLWAEIWHYGSHRAFHLKPLHWIHVEHHKGLLGALAAVDIFISLNFYGIAAWYVSYLIINSFSHANFEIKPIGYNRMLGKVITSATYHSLHHSRYTGNYGLGTRILDQIFMTEWDDYEPLYDRISQERRPLSKLRERVESS
jgi:lathosterol oxidase